MVQLCLNIMQGDNYETSVRNAAAETLLQMIEHRPKLIAKQNLVPPILGSLMDMISKSDVSAAGNLFSFADTAPVVAGEDDDEDDDKFNVQRMAQSMIDQMAIFIPSKFFADPALDLVAKVGVIKHSSNS
jgi:hypothetical protein